MVSFRRCIRPVSLFTLAAFFAVALYVPAAQSAMIGTETIVNAEQYRQTRDRLHATLDREDVKRQLEAQGVDPLQLKARVDALTDAEAHQLAAHMETTPAGGDALVIAAVVFLALLVTDILGYTDIFPFVKKTAR